MVNLCAHLGYQFQEFEPLQRLPEAARAGFRAIEWPSPYRFDAHLLRDLLQQHNLEWVQVTLPTGGAGEKGLTALPGREADFERGLDQAIDYALKLGAQAIHPMAGVISSWDEPEVQKTYLRNLRLASTKARQNNLELLVEVIGAAGVPGYAMCDYNRAAAVFDELGVDQPKLILDAFHAQTLTGDAVSVVREWSGRIGHVQIADVPGRHEPGTGSLDFDAFFSELESSGYHGWVGCEYVPQSTTLEGLHYLSSYLNQR